MERRLNAKGYSAREEQRLLDALGRGLLKEFPNPSRTGCPGSDVLKRIASHEMPLSEAEKWLDHVTSCSPCYRDFLQLQADYRQRRTRMIFAVAASALIVVGVATWAMLRRHSNEQIVHAVVDLRDRSLARGTEPPPTEPPLEIPRNAYHLDIYLPLGSSDGPYDVRVTSVQGEAFVSGAGEARIEQGATVLRVNVGAFRAAPGKYLLQIRKQASEWVSFPLQIH
jgi:hypothetical protein